MSQIEVIGIGLDGVEGLAESVKQIIERATVLVGGSRHLNYFPDRAVTKIILKNLEQNIQEIRQLDRQNEYIVILTSGDPLFFGFGRLLRANFPAEKLRFHPHLSSMQLAFSRLKIPWQDVSLVSVHGREIDELVKIFKSGQEKIAILTDRTNNPRTIARLYLALGLPTRYTFFVCENLGDKTEKISKFSSEEIDRLAHKDTLDFADLNILILLREKAKENHLDVNNLPIIGIPETGFKTFADRPGLITKKEIRLLILGELALQPSQIIWDIGAGTGSVSLEIARLCPDSQIYAIEKTAIGIGLIKENCHNLQVKNITPVYGSAINVLADLPSSDRIFIGGSGGNLSAILEICQQKINPQGRIVIALATIENCYQAMDWFKQNNWEHSLLQVQISRSIPIAKMNRFTPLNPVTIITAYPT